ncbi:MAG: DUF1501 domain-containing protein [Planctomycetales bacterium]|nr:DUF1501 domain-containing protein [Planctomycetales bacterium]
MNHTSKSIISFGRRSLLKQAGCGFGVLGVIDLLSQEGLLSSSAHAATLGASNPLAQRPTHFSGRAKHVIWIFVNGGPSQVDTWDHKPALAKWDGKSITEFDSGFKNTTGFFKDAVGGLMKSPFEFRPRGECGKMVSSIFPYLGQHVDKMAFVHSGYAESNNHSTALFKMNCGVPRMGFPCVGAWVNYGLGSLNSDLPGFVVMSDTQGRGLPKSHAANWTAGFLPGVFQGTHLKPQGQPIANLVRPNGVSESSQDRQLDFLRKLNATYREQFSAAADLDARVESFELAYRMQSAAPEALNVDAEPDHIKQLYGLADEKAAPFGRQCITARRLIERGVRFVQIYSGGTENQRSWDGHNDILGNHSQFARETDQPVAGLLADLQQRGLLDETLVIWCGEFGRLPIAQKSAKPGRDHNPHCFTAWLAGSGVRAGTSYGESDEVGYKAAVNRVHVNDLHATILHLMGIDHERLTYRYNGRDFRLTDVGGVVLDELVA